MKQAAASRKAILRRSNYLNKKFILLAGATSCLTMLPLAQAQTTAGSSASNIHHAKAHVKTPKHKTVSRSARTNTAPTRGSTVPVVTTPTVTTATTTRAAAPTADLTAGTVPGSSEHIQVTGTRLAHTARDAIMPTQSIDAEQIKARGYSNIGMALMRENPSYSTPDSSVAGNPQGSFGAGQVFSGMFNMGAQRTLTLVNGHRFVQGATASLFGSVAGSPVDLSVIPTSLIKKVDSTPVGGAAAYGSDAIAGTQNFILDDNFQGIDATAQGGWSQRKDDGSARIFLKAGHGFDHDKGNVVFDVEYNHQDPMLMADRPDLTGVNAPYYARTTASSGSPYSYALSRGKRYLMATTAGIPAFNADYGNYPAPSGINRYGFNDGTGRALMFSQDGKSLVPLTVGTANGDRISGSGGNGQNIGQFGNLMNGQDRLNLTTLGHYDFTDHLKATWEGWYARGKAWNTSGQGYWTTSQFDDPLSYDSYLTNQDTNGAWTLNTNNPFLTSAARQTIVNGLQAKGLPTDQFYLNRLNQDLDAGRYTTDSQMFRFAGGLQGDFQAVGRKFNWSVYGNYGKYMNSTTEPEIVTQNLLNALDATTDGSGNIVCASGHANASIATRSSECMPFNPFGYNQATPGARDYILTDAVSKNVNTQRELDAEINSTIVKLPAGPVRWDITYQNRHEGVSFQPGAFFRGEPQADGSYMRYGNSVPIAPTSGGWTTHEVAGELDVPLVSPSMHVPGVYNLFGSANGRYVHNSVTGGFWAYTFGGAYAPTRDISFSGNYTHSLRAPSVTELYSPQSQLYDSGNDPCSAQFLNAGPNPAIRAANCAKAGVPKNLNSNINYYTIPGTSGGNRHLQNEVANSFTGGFTFTPRFVPGFSLSSNFVDIRIHNVITSLGVEDLMDACYDSSSYPNQYCSSFQRDSSGQITNFQEGFYNIADWHMQALKSDMSYFLPLRRLGLGEDSGAFDTSVHHIHYIKNNESYLNTTYPMVGDQNTPKDSFTANVNYLNGPYALQWQTIWYGPSKYMLQVPSNTYEHNNVEQWFMFNLTLSYQFLKHYNVSFMMNNVTDARPQYPRVPNTAVLNRYLDGIIGRSFMMQLNANF